MKKKRFNVYGQMERIPVKKYSTADLLYDIYVRGKDGEFRLFAGPGSVLKERD